ncbi:MAG: molecular chaperone HtpG, partial [Candidatus Cloacimonetes bacterium]|nr:molecular chaperone HtpG [Candidatus Cloacimonadota bacterium]
KQINQLEALWNRIPAEVKREEYIEFYKQVFHDYQDPVFWIHLNVDFPFNLKGILYFPKLRNEPEFFKGEVKLFCNNVFVADNLEDLIPEFLLLLKGGIDIPDIPLNVSRSFLQNDAQVQKISKYIIKKVADNFNATFKEDRKKYEEYWEDIHTFIKFGMLKEDDFFEAMKDIAIFKSASGDYLTVEEYKLRNAANSKDESTKIWYAASEDTQVSYLNLMKEQGLEVIYQTSPLDIHLYQKLEGKLEKVEFIRIDSEVNDLLVNQEDSSISEADREHLKKLFYNALGQKVEASFSKESLKDYFKKYPEAATLLTNYQIQKGEQTLINLLDLPVEVVEKLGTKAMEDLQNHAYTELKIEVKNLKTKEIPGIIVFSEFMRRWHDMDMFSRMGGAGDMLKNHSLVVNTENKVIQKILKLDKAGKKEKVDTLCAYIHDLSLLEQKPFSGEELKGFIQKANKVLSYI